MLCEGDDHSTATADGGSSFQQRLINAIRPLVEAELEARVKKVHERLLMELQVEQLKSRQLEERCAMLEREVRHPEGTTRAGKVEWRPSSKGAYQGQGLGDRDSAVLPRPKIPLNQSQRTVDVNVETESLEGLQYGREVNRLRLAANGAISLAKEAQQTSQDEDPLRELANLIDGSLSSDDSPPRNMGPEERSPWSADRKREATRYLAPLRGNARKQAHAKDCPCCTKVHHSRVLTA